MSTDNQGGVTYDQEARRLGVIFARMRREAYELIQEINRPGWVKMEFARLLDQMVEGRIKRKRDLHMAQASQSVRLRHRHLMRARSARNN